MPFFLYHLPSFIQIHFWVRAFLVFGLLWIFFEIGFHLWSYYRYHEKGRRKKQKPILNKKFIQEGRPYFSFLKRRAQRQKLVEQLPIFFQILQSTMRAGQTLSQSLLFAEKESAPPLKPHLQKLNRSLKLQTPVPKALQTFAREINHPEVDFFTQATCLQIQTGGNLIKLFEKLAHLIEEKLRLQRDIKSFTSQGRLSGLLIAGLWPFSLLIFWWLSPQHIEILFSTGLGNFLLALSILLEIIGFWMIWKIISIKL